MRVPRIYHPEPISLQAEVALTEDAANHVGRVLRLREGAPIDLFNGSNKVFHATIVTASKKNVLVKVQAETLDNRESPLAIHLAQGISRGERMDFVLQKSVELGVASITPLFTERCTVKLQGDRLTKRLEQWQRIVISACEQSGRNLVPEVRPAVTLAQWLALEPLGQRLMLEPTAQQSLSGLTAQDAFEVLIGPEGGFSAQEVSLCEQFKCQGIQMGPRILRTETAALTAITALQCQFGDLAGLR
ncbi:16S rRNA (uracil(1498)-N(3))-methyltransferase [Aliidiomarina taiwanensis]|uniref:Ribosomal RNA small subunit methyltransferase E n=1 Tax=Aliidiomarina taiwanensis TaxID=946228 RepID=A0A432X1B8_9GAMM|nr:16S rRNA (uracil(1498)-N(3))-methyltransferase [Aliidiomarina taiwanensis]RUO40076.1 16S rRNA (uracil(1498)-N(3))-methyltransferase [Aliidiomarina taiwanensis]